MLFRRAENETKIKLEKVTDIKKINAQMMAIKSEISKNEDTLKDYMLYKQFLDTLTPPVRCIFHCCSLFDRHNITGAVEEVFRHYASGVLYK